MRTMKLVGLVCLTAPLLAGVGRTAAALGEASENWPQWRGPLCTGESTTGNPPLEWSEDKNVRWKAKLPGLGKGTPIVWEDRVFVLSARGVGEALETPEPQAPEEDQSGRRGRRGRRGGGFFGGRGNQPTQVHEFVVLAFDRRDGSLLWEEVAAEALPKEGTHQDGSWASPSALTDGESLFAFFGSQGLFAYDLDGTVLWERQFGQMEISNSFGEGSSPALFGDTLVVQWDHEGDSFIVALDKRTGEDLWRRDRDERTSWATPLIVEVDGKPQVITSATSKIRAYDLASGELVWECGGLTRNVIPSPVAAGGTLYVTSGFRGNALLAIKLAGASGDITDSEQVLWTFDKDTPYVPSPLLYQDTLYFLKTNSGVLSTFDVTTGERILGPQRLETVSNVYASPVAAAGRVYVLDREGDCEVLEHGPEYKVLAQNHLDDHFDASAAISGSEIFLRGNQYLYCLAEEPPRKEKF